VRTAIVYFSLLGTSRKYSMWLAEEIDADLLQFRQGTQERLSGYDVVVVCSGTFGGWMPLVGFLKKRWPVLSTKKVVAVAAGSVPPEVAASQKAFEAIPEEIRRAITFYKLPCDSGLKLWLTGPFSAYQLWKYAEKRGWRPSRDKLAPVIATVRGFALRNEGPQSRAPI
jgi:hypothetical protein